MKSTMITGRIYCVYCVDKDIDDGEIYIGSTFNKIVRRWQQHKKAHKQYLDGKYNYTTVFDLFDKYGVDNLYVKLIEEVEIENKKELHCIEGKYIRRMNCVNKVVNGRTKGDYYNQNSDKIKEQKKNYYIKNSDKIKEPIECKICNLQVQRHNIRRHERSQTHLKNIKAEPHPEPSE